jgi:hypothetical protein
MLPYAGFYAMRSGWKSDDLFLFFRGGPVGLGHQHEEDLEVVLRAFNKTLLYDPGTYSYDKSEFRRYVLGTSSHSTIMVDGKWQHAGSSPIPTQPVANPWVTTPLFDYVAATFDKGYQDNVYAPTNYAPMKWVGTLDKSITHTRRVLFLRPYYALVLDTLDGTGSHTYDSLFQMDAPSAIVDPTTNAVISQRTDGVQLALYPLERDHLAVDVVLGQKNPILGWFPLQNRPTPTVRFHKQQDAPAVFATFLYPYKGNATPPDFQSQTLTASGANLWSRAFSTPNEKAEVVLVRDGKTEPLSIASTLASALQIEASGWIIRKPTGANQIWQGGFGVESYEDSATAFTLDKPASLVLAHTEAGPVIYDGSNVPIAVTFTKPLAITTNVAPGKWMQISAAGSAALSKPPTLFTPFPAN